MLISGESLRARCSEKLIHADRRYKKVIGPRFTYTMHNLCVLCEAFVNVVVNKNGIFSPCSVYCSWVRV